MFHLLRNRLYIGDIRHKDLWHKGAHEGLIDTATFDAVQRLLDSNAAPRAPKADGPSAPRCGASMLTGRIFDATGTPMTPTHARGKNGKIYRYYVSAPLQQGARAGAGANPPYPRRISMLALERLLAASLTRLLPPEVRRDAHPLGLPTRVEIHPRHIVLLLPGTLALVPGLALAPPLTDAIAPDLSADETVTRGDRQRPATHSAQG